MSVATVKDEVVQRFLQEHLEKLIAEYDPEHLILFGSRATEAAREDSDIDLLIVAERLRDITFVDRRFHVKTTLEFPPRLDLLCYTPEEFEQLREGFGLVADICREGIWVIGEPPTGGAEPAHQPGEPAEAGPRPTRRPTL